MKEEIYLTTFEVMHTYGFVTIMLLLWSTVIALGLPIVFMLKKTKYKNRH